MKEPHRQIVFLLIVSSVTLAPFLDKAFHIDDPLFLWIAQHISRHPGDPYGFAVNWGVSTQPISFIMQNPPLSSYYAAAAASFLGWSEPAMHGAFLLPAVAALWGTLSLSRRLCSSPLVTSLLVLFTPVFLVSATTVMCDVALLALWVWSIELWLRGLDRNNVWFLLLAALLAAAAALTKYFGLSLVPLLAAYTLARARRPIPQMLFLLIPVLVLGGYEVATRARYGYGLFSAAMAYPWTAVKGDRQFLAPLLVGLSFTGGCFVNALFFVPYLKRRNILLGGGLALFVIFLPLFYFFLAAKLKSPASVFAVTVEGALFSAIAVAILALTIADLAERRSADSLLLCLWVLGTFFFATFVNWSVTSRTLLPVAPALAILLIRRFDAQRNAGQSEVLIWWPLLPAAVVSLAIGAADWKLANTGRVAATQFQNRFRGDPGTVWFQGHWGFQYYMQEWGAKPLDPERSNFVLGDSIIVPLNNTNVRPLPREQLTFSELIEFPQFPLLTTMGGGTGAGFYSSAWGPLPWALTRVPPEQYLILRAK